MRNKVVIRSFFPILLLAVLLINLTGFRWQKEEPKVLVFSKTNGFRHDAIPEGIAAIKKLGKENGFAVDATEDSTKFTSENLKQYQAVIFLNTTGNILNDQQQEAFQRYIQSGRGFVGIHSATDTEYEWPWYNKLVGAYFLSHPKQQEAVIHVTDKNHSSTRHLPNVWKRFDEWYNFKSINDKVNVLAKLDEKTYEGGKNGDNHPIAWYHDFDGGRAFYTAGGHTKESYQEPLFVQHILGGIQYAMGKEAKANSAAKARGSK